MEGDHHFPPMRPHLGEPRQPSTKETRVTAYAAVNAHYAAAIRLIDETCRHPAKINPDQAIQIAQVEAILALVQAIKENARD